MIILLFAVLVTALMVIARCLSWHYFKKIIDPNNPPVLHDIKIYKIWRNIGFLFNREDLAENDKLLNQVIRRLKNGVEK
jgi:hypothetical protein